MINVRFEVKVGSPVIIAGFAPCLDALIFAALQEIRPDATKEEILTELKTLIKFNEKLGVFHASAARFVVSEKQGREAMTCHRIDKVAHKLTSENFAPNGANGRYVNVKVGGGPTKNRVTQRNGYKVNRAIFEAVCDYDKVKRILKNAHLGVGYDAKGGFGEITGLGLKVELDQDTSLWFNGEARRQLPLVSGLTDELKGRRTKVQLIPPYYERNGLTDGVVPPSAVYVHEKQLKNRNAL